LHGHEMFHQPEQLLHMRNTAPVTSRLRPVVVVRKLCIWTRGHSHREGRNRNGRLLAAARLRTCSLPRTRKIAPVASRLRPFIVVRELCIHKRGHSHRGGRNRNSRLLAAARLRTCSLPRIRNTACVALCPSPGGIQVASSSPALTAVNKRDALH
jgi:hypothetical protein